MSKDIQTHEKEENDHLEEISTEEVDDIVVEEAEEDIKELVPDMNVALPEMPVERDLIKDDVILGVYDEMLEIIREDRKQVSEYIDNVADMVMNEGDSTTSSKEALVNLMKIKSDMVDKMAKVADLMTRLKMKDKNTYAYSGAHFNAMQNNTFNIGNDAPKSKRALLESIKKEKKQNKENK